ncbi:MAG: TonB-dependent receptor [Pseudomonadota bacterium]|nr:TonB-dependent receptor [Pseudomonadota bacterium]
MFKRTLLAAALACALPAQAAAVSDEDLSKLRAEFDQKLKDIQAAYEGRLKDLEARLAKPAVPVEQATRPSTSAANPELSLILLGSYAQRKAGERRPTGFLQDAGIGAPARGFSLNDTELILAANIDPYFRGLATLILADGQASVEEAWFQTLSLDHGLTLKGGRIISGIGYANEQHPHAWDFADNNLMYQTLFGEHLVQDGLQLKWLAPSDTFVELGMELGRGEAFPGSAAGGDNNGAGSWAIFGHVGGDVGEAYAWRAGLSYLGARPQARESLLVDNGGVEASTLFSGKSNTWIADLIWKWAPDGNPKARNFKFQTEYFQRDEAGDLTYDTASGGANTPGAYRARQSGWYAQGIYQFMPHWRVGLRYDRLNSGSLDFGANNTNLPVADYSPTKWSLMADYSPSEYARFRLQLARDHAMQGDPDNSQISLQYIYSLGAHGAHKF